MQLKLEIVMQLNLTPRTINVLDFAHEEAANLGYDCIGTESLLLGLIREQEGIAAQILMSMGVNLDDVREKVQSLLPHRHNKK